MKDEAPDYTDDILKQLEWVLLTVPEDERPAIRDRVRSEMLRGKPVGVSDD